MRTITYTIYEVWSKSTNTLLYIGSTKSYKSRMLLHLSQLRNGKHYNKLLQDHFDNYGEIDLDFKPVISGIGEASRDRIRMHENFRIHTKMPICNKRFNPLYK